MAAEDEHAANIVRQEMADAHNPVDEVAFARVCARFRAKEQAEAAARMDRKAVLARVTGRVQGVNFRVWTRLEARNLGLGGWVRNEDDGSVTALLVGPDAVVATMIKRLWKGPPGASVSNVASEEVELHEEPAGFRIAV